MATSAGELIYTVGMDTKGLISGAKEASSAIDKVSASAEKSEASQTKASDAVSRHIEALRLEAATAKMSAQQKELYVAVLNGATAAQQREITLLRDKITASRQEAAAQSNGITALRGYSNVLNNASGSNSRFRGGVQQVGYQIQDLVVQLQMGTSAFVAIGQQGSQLAGAFGPSGAVIGAVIALGSALLGLAFNAAQAKTDLTELAAAGDRIANLRLDTLVKINDASRDLTSPDRISKYKQLGGQILELTTAYENQQLTTKRLREETQKAQDAQSDVGGFFGKSQADATAELAAKNKELTESLLQEAEIRSRVNGIQKQQQDLYDEEAKIKSEAESATKKSSRESESAAKKDLTLREQNNARINDAKLKTQQLTIELSNLKNGTEEITGATSRYSIESATLAAQQQLNKDATKQQVAVLAEQILAQQRVNEAIAKGKKEQENRKKVTTEFETVESTTLTAGESVDAKYQADLKALKDYHKQAGAENSRYEKAKARLERQYEKDKRQAIEDDYKAQSEGHAFLMDSLDALGNASTNAISGLLSGTMSITEAMQSFANIILNQAVGALVEMGIEQVKNQMLSTALAQTQQANIATTATASIAAGQANAAAQVAASGTVAAAAAPAAAATATWSFGEAALVGGVALAGTFALAKMLGGRQFGGPTDAGMYRVGENNQPEIYTTGSGSYLISGDRGRVTPMSEVGGTGGFQQSVSVHNYAGANVQTRTSPDGKQMEIIIGELASQIENRRGRFSRAMSSGTNTKFKAR